MQFARRAIVGTRRGNGNSMSDKYRCSVRGDDVQRPRYLVDGMPVSVAKLDIVRCRVKKMARMAWLAKNRGTRKELDA